MLRLASSLLLLVMLPPEPAVAQDLKESSDFKLDLGNELRGLPNTSGGKIVLIAAASNPLLSDAETSAALANF